MLYCQVNYFWFTDSPPLTTPEGDTVHKIVRTATRLNMAVDPAWHPAIGSVICFFWPLGITMGVYELTGNAGWTCIAASAAFFIGIMLEAILKVAHRILERLPPKQ